MPAIEAGVEAGTSTFHLQIHYLSMKDRLDLVRDIKLYDLDDSRVIYKLATGWSDVHDDYGNEILFSEQALESALDIPHVLHAVRDAIHDHLFGTSAIEARIKNLLPLVTRGPAAKPE